MKAIMMVLMFMLVAGCAGNQDQDTKSMMDRIEFDPDETGCARITGQITVGGNPFASSKLNVTIVKKKHTVTVDDEGVVKVSDVPDC